MKKIVKTIILTVSISVLLLDTISAQCKKDPVGTWDAFTPSAPEEFQKTVVKITRDSVFMSMDGIHFAPAFSMEFKNDTLNYTMQEASFTLTFESDKKMKGIARGGGGEFEVTLTKKEETDVD
jgi:hypothetical protein